MEVSTHSENSHSESQSRKKVAPVLSLGEWMLVGLISILPIVNIVMLFVWAFGHNQNPNLSNYAKAGLIWMLISIVLAIMFYSAIAAFVILLANM